MSTYPGTTIEVLEIKKGCSKNLFDGIFAAGGITLSQVCSMTGVEPHVVQNWVKRKFVSSPVKKMYSAEQFARIIIINMLRDTLQIESICNLINIIGGNINDPADDLIGDDELYHRYVNMISDITINISDETSVKKAVENATADFNPHIEGDRVKLQYVLQIMFYAHSAAKLKENAKQILASFD
ncbi:MAG: DUF1836 domain-containing protein [Clostridia bacterium]|nr:DUF1836 domain-containing protein [Clostridia bacterium]